jgi:hypothetical protein
VIEGEVEHVFESSIPYLLVCYEPNTPVVHVPSVSSMEGNHVDADDIELVNDVALGRDVEDDDAFSYVPGGCQFDDQTEADAELLADEPDAISSGSGSADESMLEVERTMRATGAATVVSKVNETEALLLKLPAASVW